MVAAACAALVPLWMLRTILDENPFHTQDYWEMMAQVFHPDGSLRLAGFVEHQNDHLVVMPKVLLALNVYLFDGSRVTLGLGVWLIAAALAVVVGRMLRRDLSLGRWTMVLAVWILALDTFPIAAQHNFRFAISGAAWTTSSLLSVIAVSLAVRGRSLHAAGVGFLATCTYGTGLAVWPALAAVLVLRRRCDRRDLAMLGIGLFSVAFERLTPSDPLISEPVERWPPSILRKALITVGEFFTDGAEPSILVGAGVLALLGVVVWRVWRSQDDVDVFLVAGLVIPLVSVFLIGLSRGVHGESNFGASRYMGVPALMALLGSALVWRVIGRRPATVALIGLGGVMPLLSTAAITADLDAYERNIAYGEAAAYMGVGGRTVPLYALARSAAEAVDHVPFDGSFDADCGLFGDSLDRAAVTESVPGVSSPTRAAANKQSVQIDGWFDPHGVDCALVVDGSNTVVGIAVWGYATPDGAPVADVGARAGFRGIVLKDHVAPLTLVVGRSGEFARVADIPERAQR